ncbi:MAG: DUF805 domain-containing protein [Proteobacteria bacterium]|nr:DUF805 domain-containing protein [Pseudomonadota bacterium]
MYFVDVLKNHYLDFNGRATRTQFWMFNLFVFIIVFAVSLIAGLLKLPVLATVAVLAVLLPSIGISVRRVRDLGISGWFILIGLIPFIGGIVLLVGYCLPTDYVKPYADEIMQKMKK